MCKTIILLIAIVIITFTSNAQQGWYPQRSCLNKPHLSIFFTDINNGWATTSEGEIIHTSDGGDNWSVQMKLDGPSIIWDVFFINSLKGWAIDFNYIYTTTDSGNNWTQHFKNLSGVFRNLFFVDSLNGWAVGSGSDYPWGLIGVIIHTTDGGNNWQRQDTTTYELFHIHFIDTLKGWCVGLNGLIYHTTNGGGNWMQQDSLITKASLLSVFFIDSSKGWAVGDSGIIIHTTDGGTNWSRQNSGKDTLLTDVYFANENKGWIVGRDGIILYTSNSGTNWNQQNTGFKFNLVSLSFIDSTSGWACGLCDTIMHTINGGMFVKKEDKNNNFYPKCSPNPFTGNSTIEYKVPEPSNVRIAVYDNFGREILLLVNEFKDVGEYKKIIEAKGFTSGVYYLRIIIGCEISTSKILLIR